MALALDLFVNFLLRTTCNESHISNFFFLLHSNLFSQSEASVFFCWIYKWFSAKTTDMLFYYSIWYIFTLTPSKFIIFNPYVQGLSGQPLSGPDIGGFAGNAKPKLFGRWMGVGAMFPFCRGHSEAGTVDHEPWSFGEEVCSSLALCNIKLIILGLLNQVACNLYHAELECMKAIQLSLIINLAPS